VEGLSSGDEKKEFFRPLGLSMERIELNISSFEKNVFLINLFINQFNHFSRKVMSPSKTKNKSRLENFLQSLLQNQ